MANETCPRCGAELETRVRKFSGKLYECYCCGTSRHTSYDYFGSSEEIKQSTRCLRYELNQLEARLTKLEGAKQVAKDALAEGGVDE